MKKLLYSNLIRLKKEDKPDTVIYSNSPKIVMNILPLIDRTGRISMPYNFKIYDQMPEFDPLFNKSFDDCVDAVTSKLIERSNKENKKIYIFWSGGIDSTLIVTSFIKQLGLDKAKEKLVILLSISSVQENFIFYEKYIKKLNFSSSYVVEKIFELDSIVVTGEYADQLFGSDLAVGMYKQSEKTYHWNDPYDRNKFNNILGESSNKTSMSILDFHSDSPYNDIDYDSKMAWLDLLETSVQQSGLELTTMFDYLWWLNFNFKWQSIYFRMIIRSTKESRESINEESLKNLVYFFGDELFQKWAMKNPDKKIKDTWTSYKFPMKEYIFNFDKNKYYLDNKIKKGSLYQILNETTKAEGLNSDLEFIDKIEPDDFYNPDNWFADWVKKNSA